MNHTLLSFHYKFASFIQIFKKLILGSAFIYLKKFFARFKLIEYII